MFQQVKYILVASNLIVGTATFCFALLSFDNLLSTRALFYSASLGFATTGAYSYMRWVQSFRQHKVQPTSTYQLTQSNPHLMLALAIFFSTLATGFLYRILSFELILWIAPVALVAALYPLTFPLPFSGFTSLRQIPGLKLFLVSLSWVYASYVIPVVLENQNVGTLDALPFIYRLCLVIAITIPFDIRDRFSDPEWLKTLPQTLGKRGAIQLALFLILLAQLLVIVHFGLLKPRLDYLLGWLTGLELAYWIVKHTRRNSSDEYISFAVESAPILLFLALLLSRATLGSLLF